MASTLLAHDLPADIFQKQYQLDDDQSAEALDHSLLDGVDLGALSFQEGVPDPPTLPTRAGLYIYLNAMLNGRPLFEDIVVLDFLNARYKGDIPTLVTDLILASFDILTNAMHRDEPDESFNLLRTYLVNKLPVFLQNFAGMLFPHFTFEYCITQALSRVPAVASISQMFDPLTSDALLSDARQEFLFACALHDLIPEESIEGLLGDVPMQSLPADGRYVKEDLIAQCTANSSRIEELVDELENMDGNASEIAGAMIEIIHSLCTNNDSMTLKIVCNALCRKVKCLDVILLFSRPVALLQPLCQLLDDWRDHEDQGEHQPVYDEFGSVLLLVAIIRHRYDLPAYDLGISSSKSFVLKYFRNGCVSRPLEDLTEQDNQILGGWIRGLFETEGISDELLSTCSPKEFHLLVATLFDQSLKACQAGVLALETLKGGFEYLLEPFVLPSLISGLTWFAYRIWETHEKSPHITTLLPALQTLLDPPSMSGDSSAMHSAVLSIIAKPLEGSLLHAQRQHPLRADIHPLLNILKPYLSPQSHDSARYSDLESWSSTPGGGILASLRHSILSLAQWTSISTENSPPSYTHRLLVAALRLLGAKTVLDALLDELVLHPEGLEDALLDITTTLICAPNSLTATTKPAQLTLHSTLTALLPSAFSLSKTNLPRAEAIVRLHRRVEAHVGATGHDVVGEGGDALMGLDNGKAVVHNAEGMPTGDIDDVLVEADNEIVAQEFLAGGGAGFMGMG